MLRDTAAKLPNRDNQRDESPAPVRYKPNVTLSLVAFFAVFLALFGSLQPIAAQQVDGFEDPFNLKPGRATLDGKPTAKVTTTLTPKTARPGDTVTLSITIEVPKGFYTYSMDRSFGGATKVKFEAEEGITAAGEFVADHPPHVEYVPEFKQEIEKYKAGTVTLSRQYTVNADADHVRIQGILNYQVCDTNNCLQLKSPFEEEVIVSTSANEPAAGVGQTGTENSKASRSAAGTTAAELDPKFTFVYSPKHKRARTTVSLRPTDAKPGDTVTLEIHVELEDKWHTFTTTLPEGRAATATELNVEVHQGLTPLEETFQPDRPNTLYKTTDATTKEEIEQEIYEKSVTWTRQFQLAPETSIAEVKLKGTFAFQVCNHEKCLLAKEVEFEFPRHITRGTQTGEVAVTPVNPDPQVSRGQHTKPTGNNTTAIATETGTKAKSGVIDLSDSDCVASSGALETDIRDKGVIYVLGAAFVFGLLALLTPCVFPMVPITVSFFLKQAEKRNSSPLKMALVYSGSIILTFTVLGLVVSAVFGATYVNTLANGIWLNLFLGLVLLFFSLNLLGLFDIVIPSWLLTFTGNKESSGGYLGVFFMALTFTLTSFTCTFAFLGLILVWAANGQIWWPLAGLISFSTAFALPFFLLALFPSYLHKLPKSGGWMNRVKVVMGFIELAFMFKFLSVADIGWYGGPTLLDYHMVMTAWMVLAAITGLYLLGKIRLPHDTPTEYIGVFPMVLSMLFLGLAGYLAVGLFGVKAPEGFLGRQIASFAPPQLEGGDGPDGPYLVGEHDKQRYLLDFEAAKRVAIREKKPLFIDFTGVNCINCRLMETEVLSKEAIQKQMENCVRVQLYCDVMPTKAVTDPNVAAKLIKANQELQEAWLNDTSLPSYVVVGSDGKTILSKESGRIPTERFQTFMNCGVEKSRALKKQEAGLAAAN